MRLAVAWRLPRAQVTPSTREKKVESRITTDTIGLLDIRIQKSHVVGTEKRGKTREERDRGTHARPRIKEISVVQGMYGQVGKKKVHGAGIQCGAWVRVKYKKKGAKGMNGYVSR